MRVSVREKESCRERERDNFNKTLRESLIVSLRQRA